MRTRTPLLVAAALASLAACGSGPLPDERSARSIAQGAIVGASIGDGRAHVWRGIPFARPPVGALRWRAPREPLRWGGRFEALASGSRCPQLGGNPVLGSEDCLYLDVYAPQFDTDAVPTGDARLPVMFWIHGGGNSMGSGDQLPATRLAAEHDVVVVTINYRLGVFGWLSHPALRASALTPDDASPNFATLDMIRALEWVQENIEAFGGNPERVTIFGESAGGVNVFSLLLSPRARGLFHAAIAQSGSAFSFSRAEAENLVDDAEPGLDGSSGELVLALLQHAGRARGRDEAKQVAGGMSQVEIEAFLRGFSTEEILAPFAANASDSEIPIYVSPNVLRDGHVIVDMEPLQALATPGAYNAVPFIAGSNRDEHKLFYLMTSPHVDRTLGLPTGLVNERLYDVEGEYGGLVWRAMGVDEPLAALHRGRQHRVWAYRFDWDEEPVVLGTDLSKLLGAAHGLDLLFVFGLTDLGLGNRFLFADPPSVEDLSRKMRSYWTQFAHSLAPGRGREGDLPEWRPWSPTPEAPKYLIFDSTNDGGLRTGSDIVTNAEVIERVETDPRLENAEERCRVFQNLVQWSEALTLDAYAQIEACRPYPIDRRLYFASLPE